MDNGKIVEEGRPSELIKEHVGEEVLEVAYAKEVLEFLKDAFPDARLDAVGDRIQVFTNQPRGVFTQILGKFSFKAAMIRDANLRCVSSARYYFTHFQRFIMATCLNKSFIIMKDLRFEGKRCLKKPLRLLKFSYVIVVEEYPA
jgi:hypothetical protein